MRSYTKAGTSLTLALVLLVGTASAQRAPEASDEEQNPLAQLNWTVGPAEVTVAGQATLTVPEGYVYLEPVEAAKFAELNQNISEGTESLIAPDDLSWFAILDFAETGYVKDDEKIDAAAILQSVREGTKAGNEQRRARGWPEMRVIGWKFEPRYDAVTNRLEWAIVGQAEGESEPAVNFNTRLLGRKGVTSATLVASPDGLDAATTDFKQVLTGFVYLPGQRYADVQEGDKIAEYGLAALIAGGGAAVAAKSGLLKGLWKFLVAGGIAAAAGLRGLFGRKSSDT